MCNVFVIWFSRWYRLSVFNMLCSTNGILLLHFHRLQNLVISNINGPHRSCGRLSNKSIFHILLFMLLWLWFQFIFLPALVQYIPRNMHTVFALLCFVVVIHWLIFPYPSGLLHWHCGNLTIAPVPAKQPWWIWINTSCEFIMNDCITTTKQSTTKPCAYCLGYTVLGHAWVMKSRNIVNFITYPCRTCNNGLVNCLWN